jgi:hypothetical protein
MTRLLYKLLVGMLFVSALTGSPVRAQAPLIMKKVDLGKVKINGALPEWGSIHFVREGNDAALRFALGYDTGGLYLAAVVNDSHLVRTSHPGTDEDAVIVTFAMPDPAGEGWIGSELWLYAGISGEQAASASLGGLGQTPTPNRSVKIVEGPRSGSEPGYVLEAYIPWTTIPGGQKWTEARAAIRLHDADQRGASRFTDASQLVSLAALRGEGYVEVDPLKSFLADFDLVGIKPKFELNGDVSGDGRVEKVIQVGTYLVVTGPGHQQGTRYTYLQFPVTAEADVSGARLQDLTGDGKMELLVELRQHQSSATRTVWQVFSLQGDTPKPLFGALLRYEQGQGFVQAKLAVIPGSTGQLPSIELHVDRAFGIEEDTCSLPRLAGVEPLLTPWSAARSRAYRWDGGRFSMVSEEPSPASARADSSVGTRPSGRVGPLTEPTAATAPGQFDQQALVSAFRQAMGIVPEIPTRFAMRADLAEDATAENLAIIGNIFLVSGPRFQRGTSYFYYQVPVGDPADIIKLAAADLTGDGKAEVLFRVREHIGEVTREFVLIYRLAHSSFDRLLAIEVKREQGPNQVNNEVLIRRAGQLAVIEVRPGKATGWSARFYPFDTKPAMGVRGPLLPWKDSAVRYHFDGYTFVEKIGNSDKTASR